MRPVRLHGGLMAAIIVIFLIAVLIIVFCLVKTEGRPSDSSPPSGSPPPRLPSRDPVYPPVPSLPHKSQVRVQSDADGSTPAREQTAVAEPPPLGVCGEDRDLEMILGIRPGMSEGGIRRILLAEYRRWNSRVTNPDPDIRKQAAEMLRSIGGLRQRLLG